MKKEVLIAIILGIAIGLVITFGIYTAQSAYKTKTAIAASPAPVDTSTPQIPAANLIIISPANESVQAKEKITITGSTFPNTYVSAVTDNFDNVTETDSSGNFSLEFQLSPGPNLILITVHAEDGDTFQTQLLVTYPVTAANPSPSPSTKPKSSPAL